MDENQSATVTPAPSNQTKKIVAAIVVLLGCAALAFLLLRRAAPKQNIAGRAVPTVESVAGRAVPDVESVPENAAPHSGKADLTLAPEMIERIKLQYATVALQPVANQLRTTGTVQTNAYNETRVNPLVGGRVTAVTVKLGDVVKKGQTLATIFSTELVQEQTEFLKVEANLDLHIKQAERYEKLAEIGAISLQEKQEVDARLREHHAEHASHRQKLKLFGMTDAQIDNLSKTSNVRSDIAVPAPAAGVITVRGVNVGQIVTMTDNLFAVTDLSQVWVIANFFEQDFGALRIGTKVNISTPSYAGRNFHGTISYIDPRIDANSRTAQARIEVINPNQLLKIGMFVDIAVQTSGAQELLALPKTALQSIGNDQVVFVAMNAGEFQMRKVTLGADAGEFVQVLSGVNAGEKIVAEGSFFLRAEIGRNGK